MGPSEASSGDDKLSRICVGIALTTDPQRTGARLDTFCKALEPLLGVEVRPHGVWHYHRLLDALQSGEVDFAWLPPILAMRAISQRRVIPIALPVRDGAASYSTALFSRADSKIRGVSDLVGLRAAWVDRQSAAGYQIIRASLRARGVDLDRAFSADQFLGAHDAVARAVLDGEADVGATFAYLGEKGDDAASEGVRAGWGAAKVHIIAHAGPIPSDVVAANIRVPVAVTRSVQRALVGPMPAGLAAAAKSLFGAEGFVVPLAEHLDPLTELLDRLEETSAPVRHPSLPPTR